MTTDEAGAILELAGLYWRNQWDPRANSRRSRNLILQAARVLLDGESEKPAERAEAAARDFAKAIGHLMAFSRAGTFDEEDGEREAVQRARDALACHPEYAPDAHETPR